MQSKININLLISRGANSYFISKSLKYFIIIYNIIDFKILEGGGVGTSMWLCS